MLVLTLLRARGFGLRGVLITCDADNLASVRVIEKNGGKLSSQGMVDGYGKLVARYWVDLLRLETDQRRAAE